MFRSAFFLCSSFRSSNSSFAARAGASSLTQGGIVSDGSDYEKVFSRNYSREPDEMLQIMPKYGFRNNRTLKKVETPRLTYQRRNRVEARYLMDRLSPGKEGKK